MVGPLRAVIHSPELADRWQRFGEYVRYKTVLPEALKEMAIVICARRWNSNVEWVIHSAIAREAGLTPAILDAICSCRQPRFDDAAGAEIYEFTRELLTSGTVGDTAYGAVRDRWGERGIVELTAVIGYYSMVAMMLNAHHVPLPEGAAPAFDGNGGELSVIPPLGAASTRSGDGRTED